MNAKEYALKRFNYLKVAVAIVLQVYGGVQAKPTTETDVVWSEPHEKPTKIFDAAAGMLRVQSETAHLYCRRKPEEDGETAPPQFPVAASS